MKFLQITLYRCKIYNMYDLDRSWNVEEAAYVLHNHICSHTGALWADYRQFFERMYLPSAQKREYCDNEKPLYELRESIEMV